MVFHSPTPVRGGNRVFPVQGTLSKFQSTHPVRGGTVTRAEALRHYKEFQSTHPVRGGTTVKPDTENPPKQFQSTHPVRGGTLELSPPKPSAWISIHPPRAGWDRLLRRSQVLRHYRFQSTHPVRGGTQGTERKLGKAQDFNPPTPCGVGRHGHHTPYRFTVISIHPPRAGWDSKAA